MSEHHNPRDLARQFIENGLNGHNQDIVNEIWDVRAPDGTIVVHPALDPTDPIQVAVKSRRIEGMIADGERVAVRVEEITNVAPFRLEYVGSQSNDMWIVHAVEVYGFREGKIVE